MVGESAPKVWHAFQGGSDHDPADASGRPGNADRSARPPSSQPPRLAWAQHGDVLVLFEGARRAVWLLIAAGLSLVACSSSTPTTPMTTPTPGAKMELDLDSGATNITVRAAEVGSELYRVSVDPGSGQTPKVTRSGDTVHVGLLQSGSGGGASTLEVDLDSHVRWVLRLNGGAHTESVDMRGGELAELDLLAGATRCDVRLGPPRGVVRVRFTGGATEFGVHLPAGGSAQLTFEAAIPSVRIDGSQRTVSSAQEIAVGDVSAADRYVVDLAAGASTLTVDHG